MSHEIGPAPLVKGAAGPENLAATKPLVLAVDSKASDGSQSALDAARARRLTMNIQLRLENIAANVEQVIDLIEQAKAESIHEALGYVSWTAYVQEEFGGRLDRLRRAERRPIVELLAESGLSTRAIASVVGAHHDTVASDIRAASAPVGNPTPEVLGLTHDETVEAMLLADATDEVFEKTIIDARAEGDLSGENVVSKLVQRKVTGADGKTYTVPAPAPVKRRRRPLSDAYFDAVYDLEKVLGRLTRLHSDDRFIGTRDRLALCHQPTVERLSEALLKIEDELGGDAR